MSLAHKIFTLGLVSNNISIQWIPQLMKGLKDYHLELEQNLNLDGKSVEYWCDVSLYA